MKITKILSGILISCLLIFIVHSFLAGSCEPDPAIEERLTSLSTEERQNLKELYDHFYFFSGTAYTLFGTKPMSIARLLPTQKQQDGWRAWEKIAPFFNSENYIIRKHLYNGHECVLVANVREIEKIYFRHQERFHQAFNGRITLEQLLNSLRNESPLFQELIHNHMLVGILLGYGERNAELFAQNEHLEVGKKVRLQNFSNIVHPIFYVFSGVMPLSFVCDPSTAETKELKHRYAKDRKHILAIAKKKPLFTKMLTLLRSHDHD